VPSTTHTATVVQAPHAANEYVARAVRTLLVVLLYTASAPGGKEWS